MSIALCPRCRGLLRRDDDGLLVCWACGRVANAPPMMPVDKWPDGVQPAPWPGPKPKSGPRDAKPPQPTAWRAGEQATYREQLRRLVVWKADGKTHVAPTRVSRRGGLMGET